MNKQTTVDPQKIQKTVNELREVCHQFDLLNFNLDELISQVDAEIRNSPLTAYRLRKSPRSTK
jgi:hypothetical protein